MLPQGLGHLGNHVGGQEVVHALVPYERVVRDAGRNHLVGRHRPRHVHLRVDISVGTHV